ncbi:phosphopyruvate hydratase [Candidatus Gracilibacteria bacterium]|nr:phosphopyruvate hydratase [Candidatus Gracilibacteria bacterium]
MHITKVQIYSILDSRGIPTVAVLLGTGSHFAIGMSPSGASTGRHEAVELRDGTAVFGGKDVVQVIARAKPLLWPAIVQLDFENQRAFDAWLRTVDGTANFAHLGANVSIAASIAFLRLQALEEGAEVFQVLRNQFPDARFPDQVLTPMVNVINGGKHASGGLAIQETMIVPLGGGTIREKVMLSAQVFGALGQLLKQSKYSTAVGDEGGFAPPLQYVSQACELIKTATESLGLHFGKDIGIAFDSAASEFFQDQTYTLEGQTWNSQQLAAFYQDLTAKYPVISLEDPFAEDDWDGWQQLTKVLNKNVQVVGDDLTVTNVERMALVNSKNLISAIIIKPNQIGTISDTMAAIALAKKYGWQTIISHRSGETEDTTIADIAYAVQSKYIKTGSMSRSERLGKYNRLLYLEQNY